MLDKSAFVAKIQQPCQVLLDTLLLVKGFNRLVKYHLIRYFLLKVLTVLSSTA